MERFRKCWIGSELVNSLEGGFYDYGYHSDPFKGRLNINTNKKTQKPRDTKRKPAPNKNIGAERLGVTNLMAYHLSPKPMS